jgi:amidase
MARLGVLLVATVVALTADGSRGVVFEEATVDSIHLGFKNGSLTSTALVRFYLDQIARLNPLLRAVIEVNPDALRQAARADTERLTSCRRRAAGMLHGVPVLIKDLIATRDRLNTTAGSLALLGSVVRRDSGVVARLRRAGAVVLGKSNLPEWANFRGARSLHSWSARGGQSLVIDAHVRVTFLLSDRRLGSICFISLSFLYICILQNPYNLSADLCGSSTGSAIAATANMAAVTLGTDTTGSILCPASVTSVVGIKPTVGLTSRSGVIPFTHRQDTIGYAATIIIQAVKKNA